MSKKKDQAKSLSTNGGYRPTKSEREMALMELRQKVTDTFLKGGAERWSFLSPETNAMLDCLNHKTRPIKDIEADLKDNDEFHFKVMNAMKHDRMIPEEHPDFPFEDLGIRHPVYKNLRELCNHGNALFVELVISQFSYYVDKLDKMNFNSFDEMLEAYLSKQEKKHE